MAKLNFWQWLKELFKIDFTNRGKDPLTGDYIDDSENPNSDSSSFGDIFGGSSLTSLVDLFKAWASRLTGAALTPADKEASALQLKNQQILNEEDYQRKIDFYEMYESPDAMMRQYKQAGLNPALMFGGGASVSASGGVGAGSASPSHPSAESLAGIISAISGASLRSQELAYDRKMKERELDIESERVGIQRDVADADIALKYNQSNYEATKAKWADKVFDLNTKEVQAKTDVLVDSLKTGVVQRALFKENISESQARSALYAVQTAISKSDANVRDQYNRLMLRLSSLQAEQLQTYNSYQGRLLQNEYNRTYQDVLNLFEQHNILQAEGAIRWKDYQFYEGNRNWEHGLGVARVAVTAGAAAGAALLTKGKAPVTNIQIPSSADYMKYGLQYDDPFRQPAQYFKY